MRWLLWIFPVTFLTLSCAQHIFHVPASCQSQRDCPPGQTCHQKVCHDGYKNDLTPEKNDPAESKIEPVREQLTEDPAKEPIPTDRREEQTTDDGGLSSEMSGEQEFQPDLQETHPEVHWEHQEKEHHPCKPDTPPNEICDGKDNNCDGQIDENCNQCSSEKINHNYLQIGSNASIKEIVFSPDGKTMASCCHNNRTIKLWDTQGKLLHTFTGNDLHPTLSFSLDSKVLAVREQQTVKLWDIQSGKLLPNSHWTISGTVKLRPDFALIAERTFSDVIVKDIRANKKLWTFQTPDLADFSVFSQDGTKLAIILYNHSVQIWDLTSGKLILTIPAGVQGVGSGNSCNNLAPQCPSGEFCYARRCWSSSSPNAGHISYIQHAQFNPKGTLLATTSLDQSIKIWDLTSGKLSYHIQHKNGYSTKLAFGPNGQFLAAALGQYAPSNSSTIGLWDVSAGKPVRTLPGHNSVASTMAFHPGAKQLASGSDDKAIFVWDLTNGQILHKHLPPPTHMAAVRQMIFSPDGKVLATVADTLKLWDPKSGKLLQTISNIEPTCLAFSPDSQYIVAVSSNVSAQWEVKTGKQNRKFSITADKVCALLHHPVTQELLLAVDASNLTSNRSEQIKIWALRTGKLLRTMNGSQGFRYSYPRSTGLLFSPNGKYLISRIQNGLHSYDGSTINLWDVDTGKHLTGLGFYSHVEYAANQLAFSPDGKFFGSVVGGFAEDGHSIPLELKRWDLSSTQYTSNSISLPMPQYSPFSRRSSPFAFAPTQQIIAMDADNYDPLTQKLGVRLYSFATKNLVHELKVYNTISLAFSPDGRILATATEDHTVKLWTCKP